VSFVEEDGKKLAGLLAEQQHEAVARREAQLRVVVEARSHLEDVVVVADDVPVLDVDVARWLGEDQLAYGRHDRAPLGVGHESRFDGR
jgi:hypothetical protein